MEKHFQLSDAAFEKQFKNCTLNPDIFSHEAHLRLAWIHLHQYGLEQAIQNITSQLLCFVENLGAKDKYNHTLTIAAIKAVDHFMKKSKHDNFRDFTIEFPRLKSDFKALMNCHYATDIFNSVEAKLKFLEPELLPFD